MITLIIFLIILLIYTQFGIIALLQFFVWIMVFLLSNFLIGVKPFSKELHVIRVISVLVLILLSYNYYSQYYLTLFIMPFSIDKITYSSDLNSEYYVKDNWKMAQFNLYNIKEISDFLSKLNINESYVAIVEFTPDCNSFLADSPYLILAEDIIINRYSSAATIDKFISERLSYMVDLYYLDDSILFPINSDINPGINLYYTELEIKTIN